MQNNWHDIWNRRQADEAEQPTLLSLLVANGYDPPWSSGVQESGWMAYGKHIAARLNITPKDSLLEVGCGAGAFLYPFYQQGNPVAGIDYSANLVKIARVAMPQATIRVGEAIDLPRDRQFDVVLSGGVFHYFPTYDYAAEVLRGMVQIAQKSIGILDVPDLSKQEAAISARKAAIGDAEYEQRYRGLDHLYYSKDWFQQVLATESVQVTTEDQCLQGYDNSKYRFNVLIDKH
ncbi:methyltransferase type 12 [Moorena producens PAL-8-15-08-1]|uniref:Methyltransferase type 12 n=1 Tax=Moorena producens PAL-8-15-08-1 TaxID=1458985 RepID=A0A1D8TSZ9_9CYAN|nr:methyltransferase type 12 [Moorena producens PAL-8-15-08-1]